MTKQQLRAAPRWVIDGAKLQELRLQNQLTMSKLARAASSSVQHVCDIERGRRGATKPVITRLAAALGCQPKDLLQDAAA